MIAWLVCEPSDRVELDERVQLGRYEFVVLPPGSRPGRNDECPCGSNKKFKHCHGRPGMVEREEVPRRGWTGRL